MKKMTMLALALALVMLLTGCAQDEAAKLNRSVVRVGNVSYSYGELLDVEASTRDYYDQMAQMYMMYGLEAPVYTDEEIRDEAVNTLALQAVVLDKAEQMGLNKLTDGEKAEISARTTATMAEYREAAAEMLTFPEGATEAERSAMIDQMLADSGVTRAKIYRVELDSYIMEKTQTWAVADVKVTEEEFLAAFEEQLAADRNSAQTDPFSYGMTLLNGSEPLYAPAGYREVEWLMIDYTDADLEALNAIDGAIYDAQSETDACEEQVIALLGEDADVDALVAQVTVTLAEVTDPANISVQETTTAFESEMSEEAAAAVVALASARAIEAAYEDQLALATDAAEAAIAPEAEEAVQRLKNGEEWDRVREHYNDDPQLYYGSPVVCADFPYAPEAFVEAAMAMQAPGYSEPIFVEGYGCFIIYYVADVAEGAVDPESVRENMMADMLAQKQEESFNSTLGLWVEAAQPRMIINYTLLEQ